MIINLDIYCFYIFFYILKVTKSSCESWTGEIIHKTIWKSERGFW